jgi:phosphatidylglycerol:prolipoprotein diacylglycerol transferase
MFDLTPDPIAFSIGPVDVFWYGIAYATGLVAVYALLVRLAARAGRRPELVGNGMIVVAIAALIGGRLYHVIDQWQLYRDNLPAIVLPPYSGLGVYGGLATGLLAVVLYTRYLKEPFWAWADIVAPGLFLMQAIGRWGNFFNQELYGPSTNLPWGIPIDCAHRVTPYLCATPPTLADDAARFHPLFLYESVSGLLGMLFLLFVGSRFRHRLRPGDLVLVFFIWYGIVRFALESLRVNNWTFAGVPTAMIVSAIFVAIAGAVLVYRHRPGRPADEEPADAEAAADAADPEAAETGTADLDATDPERSAPEPG